jgi:hypothetical protein
MALYLPVVSRGKLQGHILASIYLLQDNHGISQLNTDTEDK